jgi:hypothetical protein
VDAHERARDYLSEAEFAVLLQGTLRSRHRWRNAAMLMLTFYHGLRVTLKASGNNHRDAARCHGKPSPPIASYGKKQSPRRASHIVLAGHPRLKHDLRRPSQEETGAWATVFEFAGIQGHQRCFIT